MVAFGSIRAGDDTWTAVVADEDVGAPDSSGCFLGAISGAGFADSRGSFGLALMGLLRLPRRTEVNPNE